VAPRLRRATPTVARDDGTQAEQPQTETRSIKVLMPRKTELLAAQSAMEAQSAAPKRGIRSLTLGGTTFEFQRDMTFHFSFLGVTLVLVLKKIIEKGRLAFEEEAPKFTTNNEVESTELHEFQCEQCGFTIFPARGREGKFFPDDFKCLTCEAPKEAFFDMNDLSDPRTIAYQQQDEDFDYEVVEIEVPVTDNEDMPGSGAPKPSAVLSPPAPSPAPPPPAPTPPTSPSATAPPPAPKPPTRRFEDADDLSEEELL